MSSSTETTPTAPEPDLTAAAKYEAYLTRSAKLDRRQRRLQIGWMIIGFFGGALFTQGPAGLSTTTKYVVFYLLVSAMVGAILTGCWRDHALNPEGGWWLIMKKNLTLILLCVMQFFLPLAVIGNHLSAKMILFILLSLSLIELGLGAYSLGSGKRRTLLGVIDYRP